MKFQQNTNHKNTMFKHIKTAALALFACTAFWACSDDEYTPDPAPTDGVENYISVESVSATDVSAEGGEITVTVKSGRVPTARPADAWVVRKSSDRTGDVATFVFTIAANTGAARSTTITFTSGELTADATVSQAEGEGQGFVPPVRQDANNSVEMARLMSLGWNLGNQFDSHSNGVSSETAWGNSATRQDLFDALAAAGIRTVRIPVTWLGQFGEGPDYKINDAWLDRLAEVVGYAEKAGLYVIINMHHDGADSAFWLDIKGAAADEAKNTAVKAQIAAMWTQIAERFASEGSYLMFESFNEIHDGGWGWGDNRRDGGKQYATLNEWNQTFVDAVRATGGNNATRFLGVPGYCTNPELT
ncbi:MAG: cellulase family glycosylhydrolase, partial [Muribaculaceae bacterium]|nr:cellulase family glycosylhydrolase [Muribaculaceae bacterium]